MNTAPPSISASCSPNPLIYSQFNNTTCSASVGGGATGTITWTADGGRFDTTTTLSGGSTMAPWGEATAPGLYTVNVAYSGDSNFQGASTTVPLTISSSPQTITFPAPVSPVTYGQGPITLSASSSASSSSGLTVTFSVVSGPGSIQPGGNVLTITGTGSVVVAANQAGNSYYSRAPTVTQTVNVNPANASITLTPSQNPTCPYPCATQYTATIITGPSTGSVTFSDGGTTPLGTATISGGTATMATSLPVGTYNITASLPVTADYGAAKSNVIIEVVTQGAPFIPWPAPAPITYGTALSSTQLDAGTAFAYITASNTAITTVNVPGTYTYTPTFGAILNGGPQTLTAVFAPTDSTDYISVTKTNSFTVSAAPTALTVATSSATSPYGTSVTFTATFTSGPGPTGMMTFYDGVSSIGTGTISGTTATLTANNLAVGAHSITAKWAGNPNYGSSNSAAISQSVIMATPTLNLATSGAQSAYGGPITFTAKISNGLAGSVIFYDEGTTEIGSAVISGTTSAATLTAANLAVGTHSITAYWAGNIDFKAVTSSATVETVSKATPIISVAQSVTTSTFGNPVTFTATISPGPTGTITFLDGVSPIGTGTIDGTTVRAAEFATTSLAGGTHTITAVWAANANYNQATSTAITQTVTKAMPTLSVVASETPTVYGGSVTFTATISNGPTGTVTFLDSGVSIGTGILSGTTATFPTSTLAAGAHAITANWAGNTNYTAVTSSVFNQTVTKAIRPTITWATPAAITSGTALSGTQLNATANFPGVFTYFPGPGTVLDAGTQKLSATFTPRDFKSFNYPTATATVSLIVNPDQSGQKTPVITWATPAAISYGTALSSTQLNATASYNGTSVPGTFAYTPTAGEILDAGSQTLLAAFFPTDSVHYATSGGSVVLQVNTSTSVNPLTIYSYSINGYAPNGNLLNYSDSVTGTWSFNYDSLNRLVAGMPAAGNAVNNGNNLCWSYDSFGNRTAQSSQSAACPSPPAVPTATASYNANNRVTWTTVNAASSGFTYDAAGNVLSDNVNTYIYDGEGRICAVKREPVPGTYTMTQYIYDAEGTRVAKGTITNWAAGCNTASNGFTPTNSYVLGPSNEQLTETDGNGNWIHSNVYAAGMLIATYDIAPTGNPALHFQLEDWLGSRRVQTDISGNPEETFTSLPFGDGLAATAAAGAPPTADDATEHHFTGKERDAESGLDYFGARYYGSSMGRFLSPDPGKPTPLHLLNPQRWNMYAYAINNPLAYTDSTGKDAAAVNFSGMVAGFGHEGILSIHSDGSVTYARFGPAGSGSSENAFGMDSPGAVKVAGPSDLPKVEFDSNQNPTAASLAKVVSVITGSNGPEAGADPSQVRINYFKTSETETANLDQWIQAQQQAASRLGGAGLWYNVCQSNCATFVRQGLIAGGAIKQGQANQWNAFGPNAFFDILDHLETPHVTVRILPPSN